jgi:hypothetical protein
LPGGDQAVQHRAEHVGVRPILHGDNELSRTAPAKWGGGAAGLGGKGGRW